MLIQCTEVVIQFYGAVSVAVSIIQEGSEEVGRGLQLDICILHCCSFPAARAGMNLAH